MVQRISRTRRPNASPALFARKAKSAAEEPSNSNMNPAKKAALDGVLQQIERSYGRGSIVKLGDAEGMIVDSIGSGALTLGELFFVLLCSGDRYLH